ncbi:hypothetical protein T06_7638 [Trichinella sp. T6]|nr:hypothetical protein T06_7638 [Trichinella sp. T6]
MEKSLSSRGQNRETRPRSETKTSPVGAIYPRPTAGPRFSCQYGWSIACYPCRIWIQADIKKMYLQIGRQPEDRELCLFMWQKAISELLHRRLTSDR